MLDRRLVGVRGIGNPPGRDRADVDALDQQTGAVGEPPVAAHAIEFLRGNEVGEPPRDVVAVRTTQHRGASTCQRCDVQGALGDEGGLGARGIGPRVDDGSGCVERTRSCRGVVEAHGIGHARQREHGDAHVAVDREVGDAARDLAHSLAACALFRGQRLLVPEKIARIDYAALMARRDVEHPETGEGVGATSRSQEGHALAIGRRCQRPRRTETEAARAGALTRIGIQGIAHGAIVPHYACGRA